MKTQLLLVTMLAVGLSSRAATIDCQVFKLCGPLPSATEVARLLEAKLLEPAYSFSTRIQKDGAFEFKNQKAISYPIKFSSSGDPAEFVSRQTGISFSGHSSLQHGIYTLNFHFMATIRKADIIYLHESGKAMPQPIFDLRNIEGSTSIPTNEWTLLQAFGPPGDEAAPSYAVLFRVRK